MKDVLIVSFKNFPEGLFSLLLFLRISESGIWQLCFAGLEDKNNLKSRVPYRLKCRLQQRYGLCGTVLKCFESCLCNRTQFLNKRVLSVGVPQGSVLGPVLYPIHTSPLIDIMKSYNINYPSSVC